MSQIDLLVVDDEADFTEALSERLQIRDIAVTTAGDGDEALKLIKGKDFDVALVDLRMPGMSGEDLLRRLKKEKPLMEVIIFTGHATVDSAVDCLREGSYHYLQKPCDIDKLIDVLTQAYRSHVQKKLDVDNERMNELMNIVMGGSPRDILERLRKLDETG